MVCVPCFIIPVLLYIWHKFVQPMLLRYWNPWAKKDAQGNVIKPEFPFECKGGVCPLVPSKNEAIKKTTATANELKQTDNIVNMKHSAVDAVNTDIASEAAIDVGVAVGDSKKNM